MSNPEVGDGAVVEKAGILEIADVVVINKAIWLSGQNRGPGAWHA
ncbi:MAG: hypothetical protein U0744_12720 [Gemmataceae bacterium]